MDEAKQMAREVTIMSDRFDYRSGRWLFNYLPIGASSIVMRSPINPFYRQMTQEEIEQWVRDYLVLDGVKIVRVHIGEHTLWEAQ